MSRKVGFHGWAIRSVGPALGATRSRGLLSGTFAAAALASVALVGCGSSSSPTVAPVGTGAPVNTGQAPTTAASPALATGPSVAVTFSGGYQFHVALNLPAITTVATYTTNNGSGFGGTAIDAPPGDTLAIATLTYSNQTDRPEPLVGVGFDGPKLPAGVPGPPGAPEVVLAVPLADASAFGLDPSTAAQVCNTDNQANCVTNLGFYDLRAEMVGFTPAQTDFSQPPQVPASSSATVTLLVQVSQSSPVQDIKVFFDRGGGTLTQRTWTQLG